MKRNVLIVMLLGSFLMVPNNAEAQFLKKLGSAMKKELGLEKKGNSNESKLQSIGDVVDGSTKSSKQSNVEEVYDTPKGIFKPIKPIYEEEEGWQLVLEEEMHYPGLGDFISKHHEKGDKAIKTFLFKDGTFYSFLEDEGGDYHMEPDGHDIGTYKIVFSDGSYAEGQMYENAYEYEPGRFRNLYFYKYYFTNGNIYHGFGLPPFGWIYYKKIRNKKTEDEMKNRYIDFENDIYNNDKQKYFILNDNPTKSYQVHGKNQFNMGDRSYWITNTGWPIPFMQKVGEKYYYANPTDTILSVQNNIIKYANGDELTLSKSVWETDEVLGSIHRNGGVLTAKKVNGKTRCRLTMPNGDFFTGSFAEFKEWGDNAPYFPYHALQHRELTPYDGSWNRGGNVETYVKGRSKADVEREQAAEAAKKKAEVKAYYDKICKEFGKQYVDAALAGNVIIGMPEKLFTGSFKTRKVRTSGVSTLYEVYGYGVIDGFDGMTISDSVLKMSVWVSQGRVTDIRNW